MKESFENGLEIGMRGRATKDRTDRAESLTENSAGKGEKRGGRQPSPKLFIS